MKTRLVWPNKKYFQSYLSSLQEHRRICRKPENFDAEIESFPDAITANVSKEKNNLVDTHTFWLVHGPEYIGTVQLRNPPSARFDNIKSHIYYDIRPSKRRLGYGKLAFALAIEKARQLQFHELTITCDGDNAVSRKIIEANGARLIRLERVADRKFPTLVYLLPLDGRVAKSV